MTLHYRALPDVTGVDLGPVPAPAGFPVLTAVKTVTTPPAHAAGANTPAGDGPLSMPGLNAPYVHTGKRLFDIVLSAIALVLALPILTLMALALWVESGNPFYTQERLGMNGKRFRMYKLRTMVPNAETLLQRYLDSDPALRAEWELTQKLKHDPRITRLGHLLRKTSLDELPQVLNVLKGDMSIVGPRPMLPEQMPLYRHPAAYLGLRPGITGLWQVTARNEESFDLRATLDLRYAQRVSFRYDLKIIAATFGAVMHATGY